MCERDALDGVKRTHGQIVDEQAIFIINIIRGDIVETNAPVGRVMLPNDSLQAQRIFNIANPVTSRKKE
jgi:hypothetical protein